MHDDSCFCHKCVFERMIRPQEVRKTITSRQPTMAEAVQQALAVVGKKYFERGIASQAGGNPPGGIGAIEAERLFIQGAEKAGRQWARDKWIAEHEAQLAGTNKSDIDQINDLLSEISENDRRIQAEDPLAEYRHFSAKADGTACGCNFCAPKAGYVIWDTLTGEKHPSDENAYYDRIKLEAHQARMDRNIKDSSYAAFRAGQDKASAPASPRSEKLGRAMSQPTQTELPISDQVLSARYGRNDG